MASEPESTPINNEPAANAEAPPPVDVDATQQSSSGGIDPAKTLAEQVAQNEFEMYQRTRQYMDEIEQEVRQTQSLAGRKEDIGVLVAEYDPAISPKYYTKAEELAKKYTHIRKIRGDGNCFYRAVLTAQLERCIGNKTETERFAELCKKWKDTLLRLGFPDLTTGDFYEAIETLLDSIKNGTKNHEFLFDDLNNESIANYYVAFLRLLASGYLQENAELYAGFIEGGQSLDQFCREEVEPMWKDCDHICIIALVNAIDVPIRIEYMDQSQAPNGGWHHDFPEDKQPELFFLYRPGHYDILYKKKQ